MLLSTKHRALPLLVLAFSATVIAEVYSGSTTLSRLQFLPAQFLLYGPAAILVREITRRLQAGWFTILLLGLAFGCILEGAVLQSIFNPNFLGNHIGFGRSHGVNWVWAFYMPAFHSFWAITTPILLTELLFNNHRREPWGSRLLLWILGILLALLFIAFHFIFLKLTQYNAAMTLQVLVLFIALSIALAAIFLRPKLPLLPVYAPKPSHARWLIALVTLAAGIAWYAGFATIFIAHKPAPVLSLLAAPAIAVLYFTLLNKVPVLRIHHATDRFGLLAGSLLTIWIWGYFSTEGNPGDHLFQIFLLLPVLVVLFLLYAKLRRQAIIALT